DAPGVVLRFVIIAFVGMLVAVGAPFLVKDRELSLRIAGMGRSAAIWCSVCATVMVWGSRVGKLTLRDRILTGLALRGDEQVLDVGCGRGLMLLGAAKKLTSGKAQGIDLWQKQDQTGNTVETTRENARIEGVEARIDLTTGDMRELPFPAKHFDVVVSSWAIHNVYDKADRKKAILEIARVLKPGGRVRIIDIRHTDEYVIALREAGLVDVVRSRPSFLFIIPSRIVSARRPVA
ncbi:MAG: class I SAM-dependent methyltransferase, partial [Byssovorax sp.]